MSARARLLAAIKRCGSAGDPGRIHKEAILDGYVGDRLVLNSLVSMYGRLGRRDEAIEVFESMAPGDRDVVSWNCLMAGYAKARDGKSCLELLEEMRDEGILPNARSFVSGIKACSIGDREKGRVVRLEEMEMGMDLHCQAWKRGFDGDVFVAATLVDMYAKCGSLFDARKVFDRSCFHNTVIWNALLMGYVDDGEEAIALELFPAMERQGCDPDARTFVTLIRACGSLAIKEAGEEHRFELDEVDKDGGRLRCLDQGMDLHSRASKLYSLDIFVISALIDMYGKCRSLLDARRVFDAIEIDRHDVVSWTALIMACVENNEENLALDLFDSMKLSRVDPNSRTFAAALKACKGLAAIEDPRPSSEARFVKSRSLRRGAAIHNEAADRGFDTGVFVVNSLLEMYAACGSMIDARRVFERSSSADRDLASWNSIIAGYVDNGDDDLALELFDLMEKQDRIRPSSVTFSAALKACGNIAVRAAGRRIDGKIIKLDPLEKAFEIHSRLDSIGSVFDSIDYATNTLIDVYMKCGSVIDARRVFDRVISRDIVSWNIVMLGYGENGEEEIALELLQAMLDDDRRDDRRRDHRRCCKPDSRSFCAAIRACGSLAEQEHGQEVAGKIVKVESLKKARNLHSDALRFSVGTEAFVASSLVDLFGKCGSMAESRRVFDKMPVHDAVTRTALMMGYADSGDGDLAMEIYSGTGPDRDAPHAFVALLKCARVLDSGKIIHGQICRAGLESDPVLEATLIDVYGKWGSMEDAQRIFDAQSWRISGAQRICEYSNARDGLVSWNALIGGYARRGDTESVIKLFFGMLDQGLEPDPVTFLGILTACSHAGEAETGRSFFESMRIRHGIQPGLSHYHAMVDVLGRVNRVDEAVDLVKSMPFKANGVTWRTVLSACRKWNKSTTGKLAFDAVLETDRSDSAAYVLMANIYNEVGS